MRLTIDRRLRTKPLVIALLGFMGIALIIALVRYAFGLGTISALSNAYPWGFWVSFDLFTGIAISSGAFMIASIVYVFEIEEFRPLLRPTLVTALLGYVMEALALLVELGHPERIWYFFIYQNLTSFLFFIGIYVMAYIAVLTVEFAPAVFEKLKWDKAAGVLRFLMKPVVILGAVISILHQSSLGALMLIQPTRLHPIWWTAWIPLLFLASALAIGLAMTIFESSLSSRYFNRGLEIDLLEKLGRAIPFILGIYLLMRLLQLFLEGKLALLFSSGRMSILFWAEILLGVVLPILWFSFRRLRQNPKALLAGSILLLLGMMLNRFNVSWLAVRHADPLTYLPAFMSDVKYFPTWTELAISVGIFSFGIFAFGLAARYLPVFEEHHGKPRGKSKKK